MPSELLKFICNKFTYKSVFVLLMLYLLKNLYHKNLLQDHMLTKIRIYLVLITIYNVYTFFYFPIIATTT